VLGGPVDLQVGSGARIAAGAGALWVTDTIDNAVLRTEETSARPVGEPIEVGSSLRYPIVVGEGAVWTLRADVDADVTEVVPVDPKTNRAGEGIRIDEYTSTETLAVGEGAVWSASEGDERLVRIDARTRKLDPRSPRLADGVGDVAVGDGVIWVLDADGQTVTRFDPATIRAVGQATAVAGGAESRLAVTPDAVWVLSPRRGAVRVTWDG
jgi:streptogramin lyase